MKVKYILELPLERRWGAHKVLTPLKYCGILL